MTPSESRMDTLINTLDELISNYELLGPPSSSLDMTLSRELVRSIRELMDAEEVDPIYSTMFPERWARLRARMDAALAVYEVRH